MVYQSCVQLRPQFCVPAGVVFVLGSQYVVDYCEVFKSELLVF